MNIIVIFNGLGNQMSQYAFFLQKKRINPDSVFIFNPFSSKRHNGFELERIFGISNERSLKIRLLTLLYRVASRRKLRTLFSFLSVRFVYEPISYEFNSNYLTDNRKGLNFYVGGWHCEKYFNSIKTNIVETYRFPLVTDSQEFVSWVDKIKADEESVSLHIRRGDYLNVMPNSPYRYDGVATQKYYEKAIAYIKNVKKEAHFYIFSNDIEWCKAQFGIADFNYVSCNSGFNSWRDMYLMSLCRHHINANSTFSWWSAWLTPYKNSIIICPESFLRNIITKDIYPEKWIKIKG